MTLIFLKQCAKCVDTLDIVELLENLIFEILANHSSLLSIMTLVIFSQLKYKYKMKIENKEKY